MGIRDDIELYLPKYLSEDNLSTLKQELKAFGRGLDSGKYFTSRLKDEPFLFQGDGTFAKTCNFPNPTIKENPVLLLSNTCDMDFNNVRINPCRIMYAPILNLEKYIDKIKKTGMSEDRINNHIQDVKNQTISQIFYLPTESVLGHDSFVIFDMALSIPVNESNVKELVNSRFFTLSNYGFYLLLLKLSYHFTRIQEKVDRS